MTRTSRTSRMSRTSRTSRMSRMSRTALVAAAVACVAAACGSPEPPSRPEVLTTLANEFIVPGYEEAASALGTLDAVTRQLCTAPDEARLAEARDALADARRAWKGIEAAWVGPVMDRRSWALIDWPTNEEEIRELIDDTSAPAIEAAYIKDYVGADQRGLGTAELLLGGDVDSLAGRPCDYLRSAVVVADDEIGAVAALWTGGDAVEQLLADGVDPLVNDALFLTRRMGDMELGGALGALDRDADPDAIVEGPRGLGVQDGLARLAGLRGVFLGTDGAGGLSPLLSDELVERLDADLTAAEAAWAAIPAPLRAAAVAQPDLTEAARAATKQLQITISTEVVSQLGVAVGFSDLDGDSGG